MRIDEQIKLLCLRENISLTELARRLDKTPQAFSQKMKRGSFSVEELNEIAIVTNCAFRCEFVFDNGDKITVL